MNFFKIVLFLCIAGLGSRASAEAGPAKRLRIGAVLSLTGAAAIHGNNILAGLKLARKDLERDGWTIELLVEDDGTTPAKSVAAIQKLATGNVHFFVGPTWSYLIAAAAPVLQRQNLLTYAPAASWEVGGGPNPAVLFGTRLSSDKQPVFVEWLKSHSAKNMAVVLASSDWADVHLDILKRATAQSGTTITRIEHYNYGDEESALPSIAIKVCKDSPDTIFSTGSKEGLGKLSMLLESYKCRTNLLGLEDLRDAREANLTPPAPTYVKMYSLSQPFSRAFVSRYEQEYGKPPGIYSDTAYDGLKMIAQAVAAVGDSVPAVRDYLRSCRFSYPGYAGVHTFTDNGNTKAGTYEVNDIRSYVR